MSTQKAKANTKAKKERPLKGEGKDRSEGTRKSTRIAGAGKRKTYGEEDEEEGSKQEKKKKKQKDAKS